MKKLLLVIMSLISLNLLSQEIEFNGFLDSFHAIKIKDSNDFTSSKNRFRGKIQHNLENYSMFVSFNSVMDNLSDSSSEIDLHEAYIDFFGSTWDARIGKQLITWGKADGIRLTDNICPADFSEFITQDFDDTRIPIESMKIRWIPNFADFEFIWIPFYRNSILPTEDSPWFLEDNTSDNIYHEIIKPDKNLESSEIAGKISLYFSKIDIAFSGFYTWNDFPVLEKEEINKELHMFPKIRRQTILGFENSSTLGNFVLRGEQALHLNEYLEKKSSEYSIKKDVWKHLDAIDWYPGNDWSLSLQYYGQRILNFQKDLSDRKQTTIATLNITKQLFNQSLEISNMVYYSFEEEDFYEQLIMNYAFSDELHVEIGVDFFEGKTGQFGMYKDNSQIRTKIKYSF